MLIVFFDATNAQVSSLCSSNALADCFVIITEYTFIQCTTDLFSLLIHLFIYELELIREKSELNTHTHTPKHEQSHSMAVLTPVYVVRSFNEFSLFFWFQRIAWMTTKIPLALD